MHGAYGAILRGVRDRGDGGVLYVRENKGVYCFPVELNDQNARDTLEDLLAGEDAKRVFYVIEERDGKAHILAYPREEVFRSALPTRASAEIEEVPAAVSAAAEERDRCAGSAPDASTSVPEVGEDV